MSKKHILMNKLKRNNYKTPTGISANIATLELNKQFDRIISIEMFGHVQIQFYLKKYLNKLVKRTPIRSYIWT